MVVTIVLIALGALATVISINVYHKNDAPIEQFAEEIIRDATGIDIDFTPDVYEES